MSHPWQRHSYRVSFTNPAGIQLAGIVDRPKDAATHPLPASIPAVVFSHCFTCSKDLKAIARISRYLAGVGIAVLRFDMTGLGGSGGDFSQSNFSTNLADLSAAIGFAREEFGRVTSLVGHSFGGAASLAVAAGMASSDGANGSKLTSADEDPAPDDPRSGLAAVVTLAAPSETIHLARLLEKMNPDIQQHGQGEVTIGGRNWTITRQMLDDFRQHALPDQLPKIPCPVLVIHSPQDRTVSYEHALRIAGLIRNADGEPTCSLLTLDRADHLLVDNPRDANFVAQSTAAFLWRYAAD